MRRSILEIARELSIGEYQDRRAVIARAMAALGGLIVPAAVYLAVVGGGEGAVGWGSPFPPTPPSRSGLLALVGPALSEPAAHH